MRVLLVRLSALGDVVQSLGAVRALAEAQPEWELVLVTQRANAPLLEALPFPLRVVTHDRGGGVRAYLRTARALGALAPDAAIDLQGNWKAAGLVRASGAKRRIGIAGPERRERSSALLLNERVADASAIHPARAALALVRVLAPDARDLLPELRARDEEVEDEARALAALGVDATRPFRVLVVADQSDPRAWPIAAMAREAAASEPPVVWLAGPDEHGVTLPEGARALRHAPGGVRRLIALGALVARAKGEVIGPDRGAVHVLAAVGAATTALFGPQDPARTAPPVARVIRHAHPPPCMPCRARRCTHAQGPICMDFTPRDGHPL